MDEQFFTKYSPSELYSSVGCGGEYISYEDQNLAHLDVPFLFPSEALFKLKSFIEICQRHHMDDSAVTRDYEEVWVAGSLKARGGFYSGRPCGCWRFFNENGQCAEVVHLDVEGNIYSEHVLFYSNGQRMFSFCHQGDVLSGPLMEWFSNGQIKREERFREGKHNGMSRSWHENGRLEMEREFENDTPVGGYTLWDQDGLVIMERIPVEYTKVFQEKEYTRKGQLKRIRSYLADYQMHGEETSYYDYERQVMREQPEVKYYLNNKEVNKVEYFARTGGVL